MLAKSKKATKVIDKTTSKKIESSKDTSWNTNINSQSENKKPTKKVVVKRRKVDLVPSRASAVAIASQASRAKKQALIEKFSSWENIDIKKKSSSSTRIPLWVWIFFWCSLLLFCISFYQAVIRPQLDKVSKVDFDNVDSVNIESTVSLSGDRDFASWDVGESDVVGWLKASITTAEGTIENFFKHLSAKEFDIAFNMFTPSLQRSSEILEHFTSFRMDPFISWIKWGELTVSNIHFISKTDSWKDKYGFNVSYVLESDQQKYDEEREFVLGNLWNEFEIISILCVTNRCSYHPIFWPENFGLMK